MSLNPARLLMIASEQSWFENSIISLLFPAKHCDAVSGWGKEGLLYLQRMGKKAQPDGELIDSKVEASHMLNTC